MTFKRFVYIDPENISENEDLLKWLNQSLAHIAILSTKSVVHKKKRKS